MPRMPRRAKKSQECQECQECQASRCVGQEAREGNGDTRGSSDVRYALVMMMPSEDDVQL